MRRDRLLLDYSLKKFHVVPWLFFEVRLVASVTVRIFISLKKFHVVSWLFCQGSSIAVRQLSVVHVNGETFSIPIYFLCITHVTF